MSDPQSVERFRDELTVWLGGEEKGKKVMTTNEVPTVPVEAETAAADSAVQAGGAQAERKAIAGGLFKGLFQEEVDERNNTVSFLLACLISALYDWRNQEKDEPALDELLAEFTAALKGAMQRDPEAEPYLVDYALHRAPFEELTKAGARNSRADQALLGKMHDMLIDCGVPCTKIEEAGEDDAAAKTASVSALADATTKVAALEADLSTLREEKSATDRQLELALKAAEDATALLELERATSLAAVKALECYGKEPLPRAGVSVS